MTWVKICGITNLEDALIAVDAGADAVGFVFYEKSPRFVTVKTAREIIAKLPENVERVGVFVLNANIKFGIEFVDVGLTATQNYLLATEAEKQDPEGTKAFGASLFPKLKKSLMALPAEYFSPESATKLVTDFERLRNLGQGHPGMPDSYFDTFLLDSGGLREPGGTGETFDWEKAKPVIRTLHHGGLKVIVAGGLRTDNVSDAISILRPWGVDVASGVEERPGKKNPEKVRGFVKAVREYDARVS